MFSCKVLVGPIATDKEYHAGDTVCLDKKDADTLSGFGLVEIIGEVEPKFVAQVLPPTDVVEAAPTIDLFPVADEIPATVGEAASAEAPAVVTEITPVIETPAIETPVVVAPEIVTPETVIETPVAAETAPIDETTIVDGEEAINLEEVSTGSKRRK